jgi:hypothetical protein
LTLYFNEGEVLSVWNPKALTGKAGRHRPC